MILKGFLFLNPYKSSIDSQECSIYPSKMGPDHTVVLFMESNTRDGQSGDEE